MLKRQKNGRGYTYFPKLSEREMERRRAAELVRRLLSESTQRPDFLLSCFVDAVHQYDNELLHQLEAKIEQKKIDFS